MNITAQRPMTGSDPTRLVTTSISLFVAGIIALTTLQLGAGHDQQARPKPWVPDAPRVQGL